MSSTSVDVRFAPRRLAHANFWVSDLERSLSFYRDICGLTQVFDEPGISAVFLSNGNSHHDLALMQAMTKDRIGRLGQVQIPSTVGNHPGLNHLGFEMATEADLVDAYRKAKAAGIKMRTVNHQISHSVYLHDPDWNYLEFYCDATDDWRQVYVDSTDELLTEPWDPEATEPETRERFDKAPNLQPNPGAAAAPLYTSRASLYVRDLDRAIGFYTGVLGLDVLHRDDERGLAVMGGTTRTPGVQLVVSENAPGLHHFGLEVANEQTLERSRQQVADKGIAITATIDKADKVSFVVTDPDGMKVEFFVPRPTEHHFAVPTDADPAYLL